MFNEYCGSIHCNSIALIVIYIMDNTNPKWLGGVRGEKCKKNNDSYVDSKSREFRQHEFVKISAAFSAICYANYEISKITGMFHLLMS